MKQNIVRKSFYAFVAILLSTCLPSLAQSPEKISTPPGPYPLVTLPPDADPNGPDWKGIDLAPHPPVLPLSPAEEAKKFVLQPGYKMTPVLTDPQIEQPGEIAFDGNGRMFVLELRTYMLDADSKGELEPKSRISRWEDKNNDGVYETSTVFVDNLVFPRFVLPYGADCVLAMESDQDNVYKYTDTNKDGKADKKELFTTKFGRSGNVEHQQAMLYWGMDNWLYSTVNAFRVRYDGSARETTGSNGAQWGATHDNEGKMWFQSGAGGVPSYFQFPIHYGRFTVADQLAPDFNVAWGAPVIIADMQGGMDEVRMPEGTLTRVTGSAGNDVFRGTKLPANMIGQYFYGEPVARMVRQVNPEVKEGLTYLSNVYQDQKAEFIRSTDPMFRPVDMTTAPDGTMYITDMYHGIIQEGQWTQKGTYLRTKIEQYQLDKVISKGRIWRLTYEGMDRDKTKPNMLNETPAQLVKHLENPNGWWRDMAQQLLVLKGDKSVVPALQTMARSSKNTLARYHALWTLEGLGALDVTLVRDMMKDSNPKVQIQAIRASETLYKAGEKSLATEYNAFTKSSNVDVAIQGIMTVNLLKVPEAKATITAAMAANPAKGVQVVGGQILNPPAAAGGPGGGGPFGGPTYTAAERAVLDRGQVIYTELCSQCHGENAMGTPVTPGVLMAPALAANLRVQGHGDYIVKVLLKGMNGPVDGKNYAGAIMIPMAEQSDEWIASVTSYVRNSFTNSASFVTPEEVAKLRASLASRTTQYKYDELIASVPKALSPESSWKVTASHTAATRIGGTASPAAAFNFEGWSTGVAQTPGMFFQIELPVAIKVSGIEFTSAGQRGGGGNRAGAPGGAGRGAGPGGAAPGAGGPGMAPPAGGAAPATGGPAAGGPPAGGPGGRGNAFAQMPQIPTSPRAYTVQVSMDGAAWTNVAEGKGVPRTVITFPATQAKFIRINQTETATDNGAWSMSGMKVYEAGK